MPAFKKFLFGFSALLFFAAQVFSQQPEKIGAAREPSARNAKVQEKFVAPDGSFTIALSNVIAGFRRITPGAGIKGGSQFFWRTPDGEFFASYFDNESPYEDARAGLRNFSDGMLENLIAKGGRILSRREISLNDSPGLEIRILLKEGETGVFRYYLVKNRIYTLSTRWAAEANGAAQLKILDSFKLLGKSKS